MKKHYPLSVVLILLTFSAFSQEDRDINIDKVYEVNIAGTIYMDTDDADVKITGTDRKDAHVKIFRRVREKGIITGEWEFKVEVDERNGNLHIKDFEKTSSFTIVGYREEEYRIALEIPKTMQLKIKGDDGDYRVTDVNGHISMDLDDADAHFHNCQGDRFEFDFDDGDIYMDVAKGYLKLNIDDGDFEVDKASFSEIDVDADDGDISITTDIANNGVYNFVVDDGSVDFAVLSGSGEFTVFHDDASISISSDFDRTFKDNNKTIAKLGNGSAKVKVRSDDGRIRFRTI